MRKKKPTRCTVCLHREAPAIDRALAAGCSVTAISRRYKLGIDALYRHRANHLSPAVRAKLVAGPDLDGIDLERLRAAEEQSLLAGLVALRARLFHSLSAAEEAGDGGMISKLAGALHRNYELTGELVGQLSTGSTTINQANILVSDGYLHLRGVLLSALKPYPDAARAVAAALHQIEHRAADEIEREAARGFQFVGGDRPAGRPPMRVIDGSTTTLADASRERTGEAAGGEAAPC